MAHALVPEFAVSDWRRSRHFHCEVPGFGCPHERPEEGFSHLSLEGGELMIHQIGVGRTFDGGHMPDAWPFGRGLNVQIVVSDVAGLRARLEAVQYPLFLPLEGRCYRVGEMEEGYRQFVVADRDGYLLRFCQDLGECRAG